MNINTSTNGKRGTPASFSAKQTQPNHTKKPIAGRIGRIIGPDSVRFFTLKPIGVCFVCEKCATAQFVYSYPSQRPKMVIPLWLCPRHAGGLLSSSLGDAAGLKLKMAIAAGIRLSAKRYVDETFNRAKIVGDFQMLRVK